MMVFFPLLMGLHFLGLLLWYSGLFSLYAIKYFQTPTTSLMDFLRSAIIIGLSISGASGVIMLLMHPLLFKTGGWIELKIFLFIASGYLTYRALKTLHHTINQVTLQVLLIITLTFLTFTKPF